MKRIPLVFLNLFALSMVIVASVYAQVDSDTTSKDVATISMPQSLSVTETILIDLNGHSYKVEAPITLNFQIREKVTILAQQDLTNTSPVTVSGDVVGDLQWSIIKIEYPEGEYNTDRYGTIEPSSKTHLVVVESELKNLDVEPFSPDSGINDVFGYNGRTRYKPAYHMCEEMNPGSTVTCIYIFDIPRDARIMGLDVKGLDHARIAFTN